MDEWGLRKGEATGLEEITHNMLHNPSRTLRARRWSLRFRMQCSRVRWPRLCHTWEMIQGKARFRERLYQQDARGVRKTVSNILFLKARKSANHITVAGTILGLVSKAGAYYNGVVLVTDGGRVGQLPSTY
jgi:hypothetical protein